jgi:hypothetical protein
MLKFFYNGIKDNGGKLQLTWYSEGPYTPESGLSPDTITIAKRDLGSFSDGIAKVFVIQNHTDSQSDYFDKDRIRVAPHHPLYPMVKDAMLAARAKMAAREAKRNPPSSQPAAPALESTPSFVPFMDEHALLAAPMLTAAVQ